MRCSACQTELPPDVAYCTACGTALSGGEVVDQAEDGRTPFDLEDLEAGFSAPLVYCEGCGKVSSAISNFCTGCGLSLRPQVPNAGGDPGDERRTATVIHVDVVGFTRISESLTPEGVKSLMDSVFTVLTREIVTQGGVVDKFIGDAVLAAFGVPWSHGDDPRRAVEAALSMHEALELVAVRSGAEKTHPIQVRIGVETGEVVVGRVAGGLRPTVTGTPVTQAMALEAAAPPGGTLIGEETWRQVRDHYRLVPHSSPHLDRPCWRVVGRLPGVVASQGIGSEPLLVGRDLELSRLTSLLDLAVENSRVEIVTLSGPAGSGKSRLVREWTRMLGERKNSRVLVYGADCSALGAGGHADLLAQWLRAMAGGGSGASLSRLDVAQLVEQTLDSPGRGLAPEREEVTHLICHLLGIDAPVGPWLAPILRDPAQLRHRTVQAVAAVLAALARRSPLLLIGEDYHLARPSARELIERVLAAVGEVPLLFLRVTRHESHPRTDGGEAPSAHHEIRLAPLGRGAVVALLQSAVGESLERVSRLAPLLIEITEGNPLFLLEIIRDLREMDALNPILAGESDPSERVPGTLRRLVQARIDRLPPEEKRLLRSAAVVGTNFWEELLERMGNPGPARSLASLEGRGLVRRRRSSIVPGTAEYVFTSAVLREVAYENVLLRMRRFLHLVTASWLEERLDKRRVEFAEALSFHLFHGGRKVLAGRYLMAAADRSRALYSLEDARALYLRAEELLKDLPEEDARRCLAQVLEALGNLEDARSQLMASVQRYQAALAVRSALGTPEDRLACSRLELRLGESSVNRGRVEEGLDFYATALARLDESLHDHPDGRSLYAEICKARGWALMRMGQVVEAEAEFERGIASFTPQTEDERMIAGRLHSAMGMLERSRGRPLKALERHRLALTLARSTENLELRCICLVNWAAVLVDLRQFDNARACYEEALAVQRRIGKTDDVAVSLTNLAAVAFEQGYDDQVRTCTAEALAYLEPLGTHYCLPELYRVLADFHLRRRELGEARAQALRVVLVAERFHQAAFVGMAQRILGEIDILEGRRAEGLQRLMAARRGLEAAGEQRELARCLIRWVAVAAETPSIDRTYLRATLERVRSLLEPYPDDPMIQEAGELLAGLEGL